jgi:hypothetical protein
MISLIAKALSPLDLDRNLGESKRRFNPWGLAMSLSDFSTQMISDVLMVGVYWAVAWGIGWLTGSSGVFYLIGALATIVGLGAIIEEIRSQLDEALPPYP